MWGSVETTVKLAFTGLAGFTLACVVIETAGTVIGTTVAGSSESQNYFVTRTVVELLLAVWKSRGRPGSVERRGTGIATPSSRRRVDGVEDDAAIQHERAVKF